MSLVLMSSSIPSLRRSSLPFPAPGASGTSATDATTRVAPRGRLPTCRIAPPLLLSRRTLQQGTATVGVVVPLESQREHKPSLQPLVDLVQRDMEAVNRLILSKAGSNVDMIPEIAGHLISSGGKRLRPMLTLAFAQLFGYRGDGHVRLAASVEFMHTA